MALGQDRGVKVLAGFLEKRSRTELKNVSSPDERRTLLADAITIVGTEDISGEKVLLLDDLYRSGATLEACTKALYDKANVDDVCVLTMTKTRSNR